ncbi:hypothetical protein KEU06_13700 [Pseudaminobacter sp. 19-2017]|uniref:Uncharacterized protein n=1 Tax=Pseudaminobacter soli (ex Zhang et al. 2022) TaxID=2831468 RepID=A0A942E744_9HYPH|nr:hypothetical protein [Pseudaminobacter soli]MBS3649662.1 hypothetical protein [Pseudaminobacter soli]
MRGETEIEMVRRHVREGERHVAIQKSILDDLAAAGRPTDLAKKLLAEFEETLAQHRAHLARLET